MFLSKYNKNSILFLKKYQSCYTFLNNRIVESFVFFFKYKCYLDLGFNALIDYKVKIASKKIILLTINNIKSIFEDILIHDFTIKYKFIFGYIWFFIRKCYKNCCYLKGIFLNDFEGGFCIGICGTIGFLPQNKYSLINLNKTIKNGIFFITKLNLLNKTYVLSQENILKQSTRVFFKLTVGLITNASKK